MTPSLASEFHAPVLTLWAGMDGINLGYVGGTVREVVWTYDSFAEASEAYRIAKSALCDEPFRGKLATGGA